MSRIARGASSRSRRFHRLGQAVRRAKLLCVVLPVGYATLGLVAVAAPGHEVFPFFCWFLFPVTPSHVDRYSLEVQSDRGRWFEPAVAYESSRSFGALRNSMDLQVAVQALGGALEAGDVDAAQRTRQRIEANFLSPPCSYTVVHVGYRPIERWHGGPKDRRKVQSFTCGEFP